MAEHSIGDLALPSPWTLRALPSLPQYNRRMPSTPDLSGHAALVTGAARRLGRAFAEALAARGASVAVHYGSSGTAAEEVVEGIVSGGGNAIALQADLSDSDQASALIDRAIQAFGELDLLVNSASLFEPISFPETTPENWNQHLAVNLTAPMLLCQAFAQHRAGRPGSIVNLLDWRALRPGSDHFPYTISKAALEAMTRSLAVALAPEIRVNGLALGAILPPSSGETMGNADELPLGRIGTVEETVESLLFLLAGPNFMTGEILLLDGGRMLI